MTGSGLDGAVGRAREALRARAVPAPRALLWLATGAAGLRARLAGAVAVPLPALDAPAPWTGELVVGALGETPVWIVEPGEEPAGPPPWHRAFPCWLAAAAGARVLVVSAAGAALPRAEEDAPQLAAGTVAVLRDHVNLSGGTPLAALGESRLGPLFPDQTTLHDPALRAAALSAARGLGLEAQEAVAACSPGPALETPAERRYFARAGAAVSVQALADPLIAAAHAGLVGVALVAVADVGARPVDLASLVATARAVAPGLDDLVAALAPDLARRAADRDREVPA